jgi:hypothetical protein
VVAAFLAAPRNGDFGALLELLDPDVVLNADAAAVATGAPGGEVRGAREVAQAFAGRARAARLALVDGAPGAVWAPGGRPRVAVRFIVEGATIVRIDLVADPDRLEQLEIAVDDA